MKYTWLYSAAALVLILVIGGTGNVVSASLSETFQGYALANGNIQQSEGSEKAAGDVGQLPLGMQAISYGTLLQMGAVKPRKLDVKADPHAKFQPRDGSFSPLISWDPERNASGTYNSNEPDATLHPTNPLYALVSGNISLDTTTDGGLTWQNTYPPWSISTGDVVQAFAPTSPGQDTAIASGLVDCPSCQLAAGRSTDRGVTWETFSPDGMNSPGFINDRHDLWSDNDPTSPFYGRMYLTVTLFDSETDTSFNTIITKYSEDNGESWSPMFGHDNPNTYTTDGPKQFGSMGFGPNGTVYVGWQATKCCGTSPTINVPNKHRWARSTDGGVTFPISGTAHMEDPVARSVSLSSIGPANFEWNAQTDIGVDPVDGTMYMTWLRFRRDDPPSGAGAAAFITASSDQGATWSIPIPVYDDPDVDATQYMPWVEVSRDHKIHVTYTSDVGGSRTTLAHFYVQSTDRGQTWSTPFQLSDSTYSPASFMGDYQQAEVVSYGSVGKIITSWTDNRSNSRHYTRMGTFSQNTCENNAGNYRIDESQSGSMYMGGTRIGDGCLRCTVSTQLPFPVTLYDTTFNEAATIYAGSEGTLQFASNHLSMGNTCLINGNADPDFQYTIFPYWGDISMNNDSSLVAPHCPAGDCGVYVATTGTAPNRTFHVRWKGCQAVHGDGNTIDPGDAGDLACSQNGSEYTLVNFEVRLFEGQTTFETRYGDLGDLNGREVTIGVQRDSTMYAQYACITHMLPTDRLIFSYCPVLTPTPTPEPTSTYTPTPFPPTPTLTPTCEPSPTPVPGTCQIQFEDVPPGHTFYPHVRCLACNNIVSGYPCGAEGEPCDCQNTPYFRPHANITRGQISKMVSNSAGFNEPRTGQTFEDVPPSNPFYVWIERLASRGYMGGYSCVQGSETEPCVPPGNRSYFRWANYATRGQLSKIVSNAAGFSEPHTDQTFEDVLTNNPFYIWIERLASRGVMGGYPCGGTGEPCGDEVRPYFRWNNVVTRGQTSKIVSNTFFPTCAFGLGAQPKMPPPIPTVPGPVPTVTAPGYCQDVSWADLVNVKVGLYDNTLIKNDGVDGVYDASATSSQAIMSGDGYVEVTPLNGYPELRFGLGNRGAITYGFQLFPNGEFAAILPEQPEALASYEEGDIFRVSVQNDNVLFYLNDVIVEESYVAPGYPLKLSVSIATLGAELSNAPICGEDVSHIP